MARKKIPRRGLHASPLVGRVKACDEPVATSTRGNRLDLRATDRCSVEYSLDDNRWNTSRVICSRSRTVEGTGLWEICMISEQRRRAEARGIQDELHTGCSRLSGNGGISSERLGLSEKCSYQGVWYEGSCK